MTWVCFNTWYTANFYLAKMMQWSTVEFGGTISGEARGVWNTEHEASPL